MKLHALFNKVVEFNTTRRRAFVAELADSDPEKATALQELLDADRVADLAEPPERDLNSLAQRLCANQKFGGFALLRPLGQGGMGEVWLASRTVGAATQLAAIKVLRFDLGSAEARTRFEHEQQIIASLNHPYVARLIDASQGSAPPQVAQSAVGKHDKHAPSQAAQSAVEKHDKHAKHELPWIAMEYVDGLPLLPWCDQAKLGLRGRVGIFIKVLQAVGHAHDNLVVHRDLKSSNVMVGVDGNPKLLDFGIAKLMGDTTQTATAQRFFSVGSVAPEQYSGDRTTVATDVYQLGILLYELVSGRTAYQLDGLPPGQVQEYVLFQAPEYPSFVCTDLAAHARGFDKAQSLQRALNGELDRIIMYSLRKNPRERYRSTVDFANDLQAYLDGKPVHASGQSAAYQVRMFLRRHWLPSSLAALALVALLAFMVQLLRRDLVLTQARAQAITALGTAQLERDRAHQLNAFLLDLFKAASPTAANKKDLPKVVADAIALQLQQPNLHQDPSTAFALVKAALGLGETQSAARLIAALGVNHRQLSPNDQRQWLLLRANLANIKADLLELGRVNQALAPLIKQGTLEQQILYVGYVGQTLVNTAPLQVLKMTNYQPVPNQLLRLRARAFDALGQPLQAISLLESARTRSDLVGMEALAVLQSLTRSYARSGQKQRALETSEAMFKRALALLGAENPRLVQFADTHARVLTEQARTPEAIRVYDDLLLRTQLDGVIRQKIELNRLLIGTEQAKFDAHTKNFTSTLWAQRDTLSAGAKLVITLAQVRVLVSQTKFVEAKRVLNQPLDFSNMEEPIPTELRAWKASLNAATPNKESAMWLAKLRQVNSRDHLLIARFVGQSTELKKQ